MLVAYKSVFSMPVILQTAGVPITFNGTLLFMVKKNKSDPDSAAIIKKNLTIENTDGDPYHATIDFTLADTSYAVGEYFCGFKTGENGEWLPTSTSTFEIVDVIVQGQNI